MLNILHYNLFKGIKQDTASVHINEILTNLVKLGNHVFFYKSEPAFSHNKGASNTNTIFKIAEKLSNSWPLLGIFLGFARELLIILKCYFAVKKENKKPDIIYYRHDLFNSGFWLGKLLNTAAVKEVNGIFAHETKIDGAAGGFTLKVIEIIEKFNFPRADRIIVVTSKLKDYLLTECKVPEYKITVIENGANTDIFIPIPVLTAKADLKLDPSLNYVCFSGNLAAWYDLKNLVRCFPQVSKKCPDASLLIVGDGNRKAELVELARETGVAAKIVFTGMVPYKRVPLYINASEICVMPFTSKRNNVSGVSPLKLCEYLACSKPIVSTDISGLELLREHKAGILTSAGDLDELAGAIITLLKNPDLCKSMGGNGRRYVLENRSWETVTRKTVGVFNEAIKSRDNASTEN